MRVPVHLRSAPREEVDCGLKDFYSRLIRFASDAPSQLGEWRLINVNPAGEGNHSHNRILSWIWRRDQELRWVIVNYSPEPSQARIPLEVQDLSGPGNFVDLKDLFTGEMFTRGSAELAGQGLFVDLGPWQMHLFERTL